MTTAGIATERFLSLNFRKETFEDNWTDWPAESPDDVSGTYGILCGNGLVVVDIDKWEEVPEWVVDLPATFTVKSPHGGVHRYYRVDGQQPTKSPDWGDIQSTGAQVVGSGSEIHQCDDGCCTPDSPGKYTIHNPDEIATLPDDVLPDDDTPDRTTGDFSGDIDDRIEYALEKNGRLAELWEWAKNGQSPSTVGYPNDRSKAECALAAKLGYWLGRDRTAVKQALNTVNPPKWSERDDPSYRMSVLDAVDVVDNTFSGSEGGPDPEFVELVYGALCGLGQATTGEIAESDYIQCTERHTLDALDILEENGLITYEKSGRSGYWSVTDEIYLDDIDDLI